MLISDKHLLATCMRLSLLLKMAETVYVEVFLALVWVLVFWAWRNYRRLAWSWPLFGMLPSLLLNVGRIHDICAEILSKTRARTFRFKGPWFANMDILATADPANVHYIMSANFQNFPKGPKFREMFDVLGEGIFNADSDSWKYQRKMARALLSHNTFHQHLVKISREKVEKGLLPVLEKVCREKGVIDLQDVFQRYTFDSTCAFVTGYDPGCLSLDLSDVPFSKAMDDAEEAIFLRHIVPEKLWKLQRWLGIGAERKLSSAWRVLDGVISKFISMKRVEMERLEPHDYHEKLETNTDLLASYISTACQETQSEDEIQHKDDKFLRDTILNLMIAGRDTTSSSLTWFMWLVSTHPKVEEKIRRELDQSINPFPAEANEVGNDRIFNADEIRKMVYLHAAFCEALRLYPPVPFQHKEPLKADVLPSGHYVQPKTMVVFSLYAMGRMKSVWGEDCWDFRPERWISERGTVKHEPSYKFLAFNAGPRTCLGKEVAFTQMKMVAAAVLHNYQIRAAEGHVVSPNCSIILYMRDGLKVRVCRREFD